MDSSVEVIPIRKMGEKELIELNERWMLALSLEELKAIQQYYKELGRDPTDVEINTISQTWSEHCSHKTFKGEVIYDGRKIDSILKTYIMKVTEELNLPWCKLVFRDNAGIIEFEGEWCIAVKVETHNHPTALDPYGGAGTGSGGVFRDVMGVGAKPIAATDVLFFGPLDYPVDMLPEGVLHPKRVMKGAVAGIRDYGNKMGIPTVNGAIGFDKGYVCNPLVYAGCIGLMRWSHYIKSPKPGDLIVLAGGRTGRDGIHGVTFASLELTPESEIVSATAVQIGDPITEKKLFDALLRLRDKDDKPLYTAITDCGGGGLSSAIGELLSSTGAEVWLEKIPLKYRGLKPWEIWISESQERMIITVPPKNLEKALKIFEVEECEATVIGRVTQDGRLRITYHGKLICDLDMHFLHRGRPKVKRHTIYHPSSEKPINLEIKNLRDVFIKVLSDPNVASKEWIVRQYDHEVQGNTVLKPLHGPGYGHGDAAIIKPLEESWRGIVISCGVNPRYHKNPYKMAQSAIDEAIRNNVAVGGWRISLLDNFSWGSPEKPELMGALVEACRACYETAKAFSTPFISGKDSLYNEYIVEGRSISIPSTLLITALGIIGDVRKAVSMDLKREGSPLYLVGETRDELGGSILHRVLDVKGGVIPALNPQKARKRYHRIVKAIESGFVLSSHDLSEGGLGVCISEMCIGGVIGAEIHLNRVLREPTYMPWYKVLFSESNSRILLEIDADKEDDFLSLMEDVPVSKIGITGGRSLLFKVEENPLLEMSVEELGRIWKEPFNWW